MMLKTMNAEENRPLTQSSTGIGSGRVQHWPGGRAWQMTSWVLLMAPWAFFLGICLHSRRYLAPGKVWVRPALAAADLRRRPGPARG